MDDQFRYIPRPPPRELSSLEQLVLRPDPIRQYLGDQSRQATGDMGENIGKAALAGGVGMGSAAMTGPTGPIIGALLAAGYTGQAIADMMRAQQFSGAEDAFRQGGLPGAPTGPAMPLPHDDQRVGRFASPDLMRR